MTPPAATALTLIDVPPASPVLPDASEQASGWPRPATDSTPAPGAEAVSVPAEDAVADDDVDQAALRNSAVVHAIMKKIGRTAYEHRLYEKALVYLRQANAHSQDTSLVPYLIGRIYMAWDDHATAIAFLERALEIDPDNPTITDALGDCLVQCDQVAQGIAYHEAALRGYQALPPLADKYGHFVGTSEHSLNIESDLPLHG